MIRVVVVDDQALVRAGFRMILDAELDIAVVGEAGDGADGVEAVRRLEPDLVLMDIRMPTMDGIEATARIARHTKVIILTTFDLDEHVFDALQAGASGFLLKDTPPDELAHAVRVVAAGDALLSPSITRRLVEKVVGNGQMRGVDPPPGMAELTERESEVFTLIARGLSNGEIAQRLLLGEATVKTHVGRVFMKLGLRDRVQAVVLAYECGLITPGDTDHPPG